MEKTQNKKIAPNQVGSEIDLLRLAQALLRRAWIIILAAVIGGSMAFAYASYCITPKYSSSVMLYVNSKSVSVGNLSISGSDLSTARSLISTYSVILKNRTTMEQVIADSGLNYTPGQLLGMVSTSAVNNTEVFKITVTATNAEEARDLANSMARVLSDRVSDVIDGSSMRVVDNAVVEPWKVSPNISSYTAKGLLAGFVLACAILVLLELLDDLIHDEDYLLETYDIPVLAKIPDLTDSSAKKYGYYSEYGQYGKSRAAKKGGDTNEN